METKGLQLHFEVAENVLATYLYSDQRRLEQVLLNLMSNAIKFTFEGHISVIIRKAVGKLLFEVIDSGVGIKAESLPRLFKLFGKLQENKNINKTGCGIGLHISQQIVAQLGGEIKVDSQEGHGSIFSFSLPLDEGVDSEDEYEFAIEDLPSTVTPYTNEITLSASIGVRKCRTSESHIPVEEEEKQPNLAQQEQLIIAVDDHPMNIDVLEYLLVKKFDR